MRKATQTVARWLGVTSGLAGLEHGYFETLQGAARPAGLMFPSWGPQQCDPIKIWHGCEPAMSILPNFLATGILTIVISLAIIVWSGWFVQRRQGGLALVLLSVVLLLFGGGFFPPVIGLVGGWAGMQINRTLRDHPSGLTRFMAAWWPWPLVVFLIWSFGQFPLGYFFNDFLKSIIGFGLLLILASLLLSVYSANARDSLTSL